MSKIRYITISLKPLAGRAGPMPGDKKIRLNRHFVEALHNAFACNSGSVIRELYETFGWPRAGDTLKFLRQGNADTRIVQYIERKNKKIQVTQSEALYISKNIVPLLYTWTDHPSLDEWKFERGKQSDFGDEIEAATLGSQQSILRTIKELQDRFLVTSSTR